MNKVISSFKKIDHKMFISLLFFGLMPTLYMTVRVFLIGQLPGDYGFSIASQLQWVNVLYEIVQEAIILPLFYFAGLVINNKDKLANFLKTGLIYTISIYGVISLLVIVFARPLVIFMAQDHNIINETVSYIRLESIAMIFSLVFKFLIVILIQNDNKKNLNILMVLSLFLTLILDIFFVSNLSVSLKLGVNGIAFTNIITYFVLVLVAIIILSRNGVKIFNKQKLDFSWGKDLFKIGGISGLESLVRNLAFILMIVRMVNVVGEQGNFWIANNFIWGWLLLPIIQLGELIKSDVGKKNEEAIKEKSLGYFTYTTIIIILWFILLPLYKPFIKNVLLVENYQMVLNLIYLSIGFYILFAYNNVIDSIFYGLGKTKYLLFQSLIINTIFYGTLFVLFSLGVIVPNVYFIALMFAVGTALDSLLTMFMFRWYLKRNNISLIESRTNYAS